MANVLLVLVLGCCLPLVLGFPSGDGWEWMSGVAQMDGSQFKDFASPLVQLSANAYRYPGPLRPISGWSLSSLIAPLHPSHGGAHALAYEEQHPSIADAHDPPVADMGPAHQHQHNPHSAHMGPVYCKENCLGPPRRVIVAFRGTQVSSSVDSVADVCADKLLWEGFDLGSLPPECLVFDSQTLDYFAQSLNYTLQVISLYPSVPILLIGHSLGAGLAVLVAGALSHTLTLPVIGFGAPATLKPLLDRGLSVENGSIIVIGHEWDVMMRTQMEGQVGLLCFYSQAESSSCKSCISSSRLPSEGTMHDDIQNDAVQESASQSAGGGSFLKEGMAKVGGKSGGLGDFPVPPGDCLDCFIETHYLKNLIALVNKGDRPSCQQARDVKLAQS